MLDQVLEVFGITPNWDLDLMRAGQGLTYVTTSVLDGIHRLLKDEKPDRVLVQGDTTTTMAASLAAFYEKVPVAHIEAGLRTRNIFSPWPEEMNRRVTSIIADLHFAPTESAKNNLLAEGVQPERIAVTGNTVIDALFDAIEILDKDPERLATINAKLPAVSSDRRVILVTGHRRENFGAGLERVADALLRLASRSDAQIVFPVHLNPNVQDTMYKILGGHPNVHLIKPLDYLPFVQMMRRATLIITDSGGVQEEAPSLGKPVLVTRDTTERPEAVEAGTVELVGTDAELLFRRATHLLDNETAYGAMSRAHNPYGDGHAAERIVEVLTR
jgi:UDP-N-acetylglucosamine 2-epimerase